MKAAVIGAGIAGLRLARLLSSEGVDVHVFDKARGPSGRLATRRTDEGNFDHGAQYFTARAPSFLSQVADWQQRGVVERWDGKIVKLENGLTQVEKGSPERYVGAPRMSAIARDLTEGLRTDFSSRITSLRREGRVWVLELDGEDDRGEFDVVLTSVPAPQAVPLLGASPTLARRAENVRMLACHALMVRFESEVDVEFDAAFVRSSPLGWVAHDASKPGRASGETWVLHSTADWSGSNLERAAEETRDVLLEALGSAIGDSLPAPSFFAVHRWLYARPDRACDGIPMWDSEIGLGACGDWVQGDRVEDAFLSADALANEILNR
jgi:predicted NAD/FAD-dependent oxidoreductase